MKNIIKFVLIFFVFTLSLVVYLYFTDKKDSCLDTGICSEGVEINTQYGKIMVNEESCLKYHWVWNKDKQWCDFRTQKN